MQHSYSVCAHVLFKRSDCLLWVLVFCALGTIMGFQLVRLKLLIVSDIEIRMHDSPVCFFISQQECTQGKGVVQACWMEGVFSVCIAMLHDWLKKFAPPFHPIRSKTKTNCYSLASFPAFRVSLM